MLALALLFMLLPAGTLTPASLTVMPWSNNLVKVSCTRGKPSLTSSAEGIARVGALNGNTVLITTMGVPGRATIHLSCDGTPAAAATLSVVKPTGALALSSLHLRPGQSAQIEAMCSEGAVRVTHSEPQAATIGLKGHVITVEANTCIPRKTTDILSLYCGTATNVIATASIDITP